MPAHRYVEENSLAAILATMMAGVTPQVNLIEYVTHTPAPNMNKATHFGFETQRRHHQKSKKGFQWPHKKDQEQSVSCNECNDPPTFGASHSSFFP